MSRGSCTAAGIAAIAIAAAMLLVSGAAARTVRVGGAMVPFASSSAAANAAPAVSPDLRLHVAVALRPRDPAALTAYALAVSTPGSPDYRHYLSTPQFARRFGATTARVARVRRYLRARGLEPGPTSAGGLSIPVSARAGTLERAFSLSLRRLVHAGRGQRGAIVASAAPAFDPGVAPGVESVVGLDSASAPHPLLVRPGSTTSQPTQARPDVVTAGPQPCAQAAAAAPAQNAHTSDEIASAYGFSGLYGAGDQGAGVTIALYELEPDDPADIAGYQACYGTHASVSYVSVDGGTGKGAGSGEAALDIENTVGLAPGAKLLVYQGPNSNSGAPGSGPFDIFAAIINQDRAKVVSVSWGECETALGASDAAAENTLFQQAAVQGQTIVAAAGDSGAEDCDTPGAVPDTQAAVDDPASQPFVTGVGGTSLSALGPPPTESVWNNAGTPTGGILSAGAGGGGVSSLWAMPRAQLDADSALGVRNPAAAGRACGRSSGYCREVPDVAADADPNTGYLIYWNSSDTVAGQPVGWQGIGGTSGAAPVWGALLSLVDASAACSGFRLGLASPVLYRAASTAYAADFHDVQLGENDFTATNHGEFPAGPGYDMASGLGTPDAAALAATLCSDTVQLNRPRPQLSNQRAAVSLQLRASDLVGKAIRYSSKGLPPGLTLNTSTGKITGQARTHGRFDVRLGADDDGDSGATAAFRWTIAPALRLAAVSLKTTGGPQLSLTVSAARGAPEITGARIALPAGLRLHSTRGVQVITTPGGLPYEDSSRSGSLTITLNKPATYVRVIVGPAGLSGAAHRSPRTPHRPVVGVRVDDTGHGVSELTGDLGADGR